MVAGKRKKRPGCLDPAAIGGSELFLFSRSGGYMTSRSSLSLFSTWKTPETPLAMM
jgi:hypothetical protein